MYSVEFSSHKPNSTMHLKTALILTVLAAHTYAGYPGARYSSIVASSIVPPSTDYGVPTFQLPPPRPKPFLDYQLPPAEVYGVPEVLPPSPPRREYGVPLVFAESPPPAPVVEYGVPEVAAPRPIAKPFVEYVAPPAPVPLQYGIPKRPSISYGVPSFAIHLRKPSIRYGVPRAPEPVYVVPSQEYGVPQPPPVFSNRYGVPNF